MNGLKKKQIWRSVYVAAAHLRDGGLIRMRRGISRRSKRVLRRKEVLAKRFRRLRRAEKELEAQKREYAVFVKTIVTKIQYVEPKEIQNRHRELDVTMTELAMTLEQTGPEF